MVHAHRWVAWAIVAIVASVPALATGDEGAVSTRESMKLRSSSGEPFRLRLTYFGESDAASPRSPDAPPPINPLAPPIPCLLYAHEHRKELSIIAVIVVGLAVVVLLAAAAYAMWGPPICFAPGC